MRARARPCPGREGRHRRSPARRFQLLRLRWPSLAPMHSAIRNNDNTNSDSRKEIVEKILCRIGLPPARGNFITIKHVMRASKSNRRCRHWVIDRAIGFREASRAFAQIPSLRDTLGVGLVMAGFAVHRPPAPHRLSARQVMSSNWDRPCANSRTAASTRAIHWSARAPWPLLASRLWRRSSPNWRAAGSSASVTPSV